ncbi:MAG: MnhB domain-containing protein [Acidimicrobiales bacterium]
MTARARVIVFCVGAVVLAVGLVAAVGGLPSFGHYPGPYGPVVVNQAMPSRHADNAVTTVVMDVRGVDTAGEELLLYAATVGVLMLLRKLRREQGEDPPASVDDAEAFASSAPVALTSAALVAPMTLLALYVIGHGQITPGGGFQGGVILVAPSVLLFLAERRRRFDWLHRPPGWETVQAVAVCAFLAFGFVPLVAGKAFLENALPYGVTGTVFSAGTIELLNVVAGVGVATSVVLLAVMFVRQIGGLSSK